MRKIHIIVFAPSIETVEKINLKLSQIGNLKADGRPILGLDAKELTKIVLDADENCLVVPAHCLLPDTYLHTNKGIKMIKDIVKGDFVYTHKGRIKKVNRVYKRNYEGDIYTIKPFYFRLGLATTSEHPYLVIRNDKYQGKSNYYGEQLKRDYFKEKKTEWVEASKVNVGDILLFPRFKEIKNKETLQLDKTLNPIIVKYNQNKIAPIGHKISWISNTIQIDKYFCRLVGYYLAEGYTNNRDAVGFSFKKNEEEYINDVQFLMRKIFGSKPSKIKIEKDNQGIELIYYSKILKNIFKHLFYISSNITRAHTKAVPEWMLELPSEKQVEIFKGWWRGDSGYTTSRVLMNQMKIICLRLGIIPSIGISYPKEIFNGKEHKIKNRLINANYDLFHFSNLSFFEDSFNLLKESYFKKFNFKTIRRNGWIDKNYIYLPVREINKKHHKGEVYNLDVEGDNSYLSEFATVHNCWTPWFSVFGSKSGFNSLEECFEDYTKYIYAIETGLSSDPAMNWRLSQLDKITLISNSDAHSLGKIGREANVFDTELSYKGIAEALKLKDKNKFLYTIEFFPEEGKYHYDGHRTCNLSLSPKESKKYNNICPRCGKPLVIGVLNRVEELADRPEGFVSDNAIPFKSMVPLNEVIAESVGVSTLSKEVLKYYNNLIKNLGSELKILLESSRKEITDFSLPEIAEGIIRMREGKVFVEPGYDGVYGKIKIFSEKVKISGKKNNFSQKTLF